MNALLNKGTITAAILAGSAIAGTPALAKMSSAVQAPATVHQAETLKKVPNQAEDAFTSSKKKAAGVTEQLNNDLNLPATIHQEETIAGYDDDREDDTERVN